MAVNVSNPQDLTGKIKAKKEAEVAEQRREASRRMTMVNQQIEESNSEPVDLTTDLGDDVVDVARPAKEMRVNTKLEDVTIGRGTNYNFEIGQTYKVDADIYDYLDERGFVWH